MNLKTHFILIALAWSGVAGSVSSANSNNAHQSLHLDWLDKSVHPGENFYLYANGNWMKNNPIPPDYASWGSFNVLNEKVQNLVHKMLQQAAANPHATAGSIQQKVGDFYYSGMDEQSINKLGIAPLKPEFARIESVQNLTQLQEEIAHLHRMGVDVFFSFGSMQDFKRSEEMIAAAFQGGLGLPDRDYYLKDTAKFARIRQAYVEHIEKMLQLLGEPKAAAQQNAKIIMAIETRLAQISMTQVAQRDPHAIYHIVDKAQLEQMTPNFSWVNYFKARELPQLKTINMGMPEFFKGLNTLLQEVSIADWRTYMRWHLLDSFAAYLSSPFVEQNFKMSQSLTGTEKMLPRWKRVVATENAALGFAIGKMYVDKYFSPESKQQALEILKNIRYVLSNDIQQLSWMTPDTRKAALKKLDLMEERVGYPSKWWDYSTLIIDRGPYVLNVLRANQFLVKRDLDKIGKPIDRTEWGMTPQTINAYYAPSMNNLNIPAGILQAPFFDPQAPAAVNYGAIGFVMGHEMTHGFDDQGAQFDGKGNLNNWWKPADLQKFKKATQCIVNQFSQYQVNGDLHVQGPLVVGEATADLGGILLAYKAYQHSDAYKQAKTIDGFTPEQQFFLGVAHVWAMNIRPEQLQNQVTTDPHPPAQYRVNGSLVNIPQFQQAFGIKENTPMVNKNRCVIW